MAYTADSSAITAPERTAYAADKTFLLASVLHRYNALPRWSLTGSWASGSDVSATGYPARAACDDLIDVPTRPIIQSPTVSDYYLLFDLDDVDIDAIAIIGHNFHLLSGTVTITAQVADNDAFSTNLATVATWTPTTATRLVDLILSSWIRYTTVRYFRIKVSSTVAFASQPSVCEVVAGTRRQLGRRPDRPWDSLALGGDVPRHRTKSGGSVKYTRNTGGVVLKPSWTPALSADAITGIDDSDVLRGIHEDTGYGSRNLLFIDKPSTAPTVAHWCEYEGPEFSIPEVDYDEGQASLQLVELSPFALTEAL